MSDPVQAGLAVTAHSYGLLATATFDHVSIGSLTPLGGTQPSPARIYLGGEPLTSAGFVPMGGFKMLLQGQSGDWFLFRSTSDFGTWTDLDTITNSYGVATLLDSLGVTNNLRFYRAQRLGP